MQRRRGLLVSLGCARARARAHTHPCTTPMPLYPDCAGGGAKNPVWTAIRERALGVPVQASANGDAAYGSALLALQGAGLARPDERALMM